VIVESRHDADGGQRSLTGTTKEGSSISVEVKSQATNNIPLVSPLSGSWLSAWDIEIGIVYDDSEKRLEVGKFLLVVIRDGDNNKGTIVLTTVWLLLVQQLMDSWEILKSDWPAVTACQKPNWSSL
jgi:hypothetical protein